MVLDTSLWFFRKLSNATCFIINFNMCSQVTTLWNNVTFKEIGMIKIWKFVSFKIEDSCDWVRSMKKVYRNFPFRHDIILWQNYIVIFRSLSLVNICQSYIGLCIYVFLDPQCIGSKEDFQTWNPELVNLPPPICPCIQVG